MNHSYVGKTFKKIRRIPENKFCFDCNEPDPHWASVNNGILLCLKCSGQHRSFGVQISFVRSISMDSWNPKQLNLITYGGNQRLKEFTSKYKISKYKRDDFYATKALQFYREKLKKNSEGQDFNQEKPSFEEGREIVFKVQKIPSFIENNKESEFDKLFKELSPAREKEESKVLSNLSSFMTNIGSTMIQKVEDAKIGDRMKTAGKLIAEKSKEAGIYLVEKGSEIKNDPKVKHFHKMSKEKVNAFALRMRIKFKNLFIEQSTLAEGTDICDEYENTKGPQKIRTSNIDNHPQYALTTADYFHFH